MNYNARILSPFYKLLSMKLERGDFVCDKIKDIDFNVNDNGQIEIIGWLYQYYNTDLKDKADEAVKAGNKSYVVCTIKRGNEKSKTEYVGTGNYKYGASYKCLMNSKPTVTTKKNVSKEDCEAGRKEVVSNRETTITTTTCTKQ